MTDSLNQTFNNYYRLTKPGIIYGNLVNALSAFFFGSAWSFELSTLLGMLLGTSLVIASACVFNNFIDRNIDSKMSRTKQRALVINSVSVSSALTYATVLGLLGFIILLIHTNYTTLFLGAIAMFVYVVVYGWAKRKTVHGTLVGSIAGALPPVAGYTAATNQLDVSAGIIFLILTVWQMPHFYAIAIYRAKDYKAARLPMLPAVKGVLAAKKQMVVYTLAYVLAVASLAIFGKAGVIFAFITGAAGIIWFVKVWRGFTAKDDTKWAKEIFGFSLVVTVVQALALSVGSMLP